MLNLKNAVIASTIIAVLLLSALHSNDTETQKEVLVNTVNAHGIEETVNFEEIHSVMPIFEMQKAAENENNEYVSENFAAEVEAVMTAEETELVPTSVEESTMPSYEEQVDYYANNIWQLANDDPNWYWMAKIIFAESEGESEEGQIAVGNVILNRVKSESFPNTIYDVIYDRRNGIQFTPAYNGRINKTPDRKSIMSAYKVLYLEEKVEGMHDNVLYFRSDRASWWKGVTYWKTIGGHHFAVQY